MKILNLTRKNLRFYIAFCFVWIFIGCQPAPEPIAYEPVFYPKPPDKARLQFLKSFSGPDDIGVAKPSAFEVFIVGEPEETDKITKPYGVVLHDSKFYVCDTGRRSIDILDLKNKTFEYMPKDERMKFPVNIFIEDDGTKYIADVIAGAIFVYNHQNQLIRILGRELKFRPADIYVRDKYCYVTDVARHQVFILDKITGTKVNSFGGRGYGQDEFGHISDLTLDNEGNIYVTDRLGAKIQKFDKDGKFLKLFGGLGTNINLFGRPKGLVIDNENRIWVVDAASEVAKIYNAEGQLLLFFGFPGNEPGNINMPAKIYIDYDHIDLFQQYAVPGAQLEFLVIVSNQFGKAKINVYGFGNFPEQTQQSQAPPPDNETGITKP